MKPSRIDGIALSAVLMITGCALGCAHPVTVGSSSSSSSTGAGGNGGADAGPICLWGEGGGGSGGGLTFPVCQDNFTNEFMGTIDGKPYDTGLETGHLTGMAPPNLQGPYTLTVGLDGIGFLDLEWGDPYLRGQWMEVTKGQMRLPGEIDARNVNTGSKLLMHCHDYSFLYVLHIDGGDLTGCSH